MTEPLLDPIVLRLTRRRVTPVLCLVAAGLVVLGVATQMLRWTTGREYYGAGGLIRMFDLNGEGNVPASISAVLLLVAALLVAVRAAEAVATRDRDGRTWTVLAIGFAFLSLDEAATLHDDILGRLAGGWFGPIASGPFRFSWVILGLTAAVLAALGFMGFLRRLPRPFALRLLIAGGVFLGGALGVEMISGSYFSQAGNDLRFNLLIAVEETLELAGTILMIDAMLEHLASRRAHLAVTFTPDREP